MIALGTPAAPRATWRHALAAAGAGLAELLLPRACVACESQLHARDQGPVCGSCWSRVRELPHPRCDRCGHPRDRHSCRWCPLLPPFIRAARSFAWVPGGTAGDIVHALKYGGWTDVAEQIGARLERLDWPTDVVEERAALVPVPLAPVRERERGFNQSALIAGALAARWRIPVRSDWVRRGRATQSQTRLTPDARRSNVHGAFHAVPDALPHLRGRHVVLVDDVVTTGATLVQCAAALFEGGARVVSLVTFGRAPAIGDRAP